MLEKIKTSLRISHSSLDDEIQDVIDAALLSLGAHGINAENDNDPLIVNAVKMYARWQFDYCGKSDQWEKAWNASIIVLALCGDYNE